MAGHHNTPTLPHPVSFFQLRAVLGLQELQLLLQASDFGLHIFTRQVLVPRLLPRHLHLAQCSTKEIQAEKIAACELTANMQRFRTHCVTPLPHFLLSELCNRLGSLRSLNVNNCK